MGETIFSLGGDRWGWVRVGVGTQFSVNHIKLILVGVDIYGAWF